MSDGRDLSGAKHVVHCGIPPHIGNSPFNIELPFLWDAS